MNETPDYDQGGQPPAPHPAWVGGAEEFHAGIPASAALAAWTTVTCLNPQCRAKNDVPTDAIPEVVTCWVCQRQTNTVTGTLVPPVRPVEDGADRPPGPLITDLEGNPDPRPIVTSGFITEGDPAP